MRVQCKKATPHEGICGGTRIAATSRRETGGDGENGGAEREMDGEEALDDVEPPQNRRANIASNVDFDGTQR